MGDSEKVYEMSKEAIVKGKDSPKGYIFMPGCGLASDKPSYNVYMMSKALENFGYY